MSKFEQPRLNSKLNLVEECRECIVPYPCEYLCGKKKNDCYIDGIFQKKS